ncbi:hypothetical protein T05_14107 [Trichinella murrelli]|uniref:Uncharacterized protein n=1 Tax=Trichinella murrelli TaxID=144512 RepID=A0A0V0T780_9BILA|nr:hypothetical protein T05_14107 [Trichinella murrelli]
MQNNFRNSIAQAKRNISIHLKTPKNSKSPRFLESRNLRSSCQNITGRAVILPSPWEGSLALQGGSLFDIEMMVTDSLLRGGKYLSVNDVMAYYAKFLCCGKLLTAEYYEQFIMKIHSWSRENNPTWNVGRGALCKISVLQKISRYGVMAAAPDVTWSS